MSKPPKKSKKSSTLSQSFQDSNRHEISFSENISLESEDIEDEVSRNFLPKDAVILRNHGLTLDLIADLTDADLSTLSLTMNAILTIRRFRAPQVPKPQKALFSKLPSNLPYFRGSGSNHYVDVDEFILRFEARMSSSDVDKDLWSSILLSQLSNLTDLKFWRKHHASKPWENARVEFYSHFNTLNTRQVHIDSINTFSQQALESIQSYTDRFFDLVDLAKLDIESPLLVAPFRRGLNDFKLLSSIDAREAATSPYSNVSALSVAALFCESQIQRHDYDKKSKNQNQPNQKQFSPNSSNLNGQLKQKICTLHGKGNHDSADCLALKKRSSDSKPPTTFKSSIDEKSDKPLIKTDAKRTGFCFICKKVDHWAPECPDKIKSKRVTFKIENNVDDLSILEDDDPFASLLLCSKMVKLSDTSSRPASSSEIICPVTISNIDLFGLVDTGSSHSIVSRKWYSGLELPVLSSQGSIILANDSLVARIGRTVPLGITCNNITVKVSFEILDMVSDLILGLDVIPLLGITISGVPIAHHTTPKIDDSNMVQCADEIVSENDLHPDAELVKESIQPLLQFNSDIGEKFCTHPASVVHLNIPIGTKPIWRRQYNIPDRLKPAVTAQVKKWSDEGVIRKASPDCQWNLSLLAVGKKDLDGHLTDSRICIDPSSLNESIPDLNYPIPLIGDLIRRLFGFSIASLLDVYQSYCQNRLSDESQDPLSFTWEGVRHSFVGAPFGVKIMTSHFQRLMHAILHECLEFVIVYIDDIVIFSPDTETHIVHLKRVISALNGANLRLKPVKCKFAVTKFLILGHVVTGSSIAPDPLKLSTLSTLAAPISGTQLESFLGFVGYLREFVPLFASIAAPLEKIRKVADLRPIWSAEHQNAFDTFKLVLSAAPALVDFNPDLPLLVATDASQYAVGAVLYQEDDAGKRFYISFASKALSQAQVNYPAFRRELLAVMFAVSKFRGWLYGQKFTIFSDHSALVYLFKSKHENRMLNYWSFLLLDFKFDVVHRPGILNILPDCLSRLYPGKLLEKKSDGDLAIKMLDIDVASNVPTKHLSNFIAERLNKTLPDVATRSSLLKEFHLNGHYGTEGLFRKVWHSGFYWPTLRADCVSVASDCISCLEYSVRRQGFHPLKSVTSLYPWQHLAIDLFQLPTSRNGFNYGVTIVDICTSFTLLAPIMDKMATSIAIELYQFFMAFGVPKVIQSDHGSEFDNALIDELARLLNVTWRFSTPIHPQGNGKAESHVKLAKGLLKKLSRDDILNWDLFVAAAQFGINNRISSRHGSSPFSLMFARPSNDILSQSEIDAASSLAPLTPTELLDRSNTMISTIFPAVASKVAHKNEKVEAYFNRTHRLTSFPDGSIVMVNVSKPHQSSLKRKFEGPFTIVRCSAGGSYSLIDSDGVSYGSDVSPNRLKLISLPPTAIADSPVVDRIISHRGTLRNRHYLVRWSSYPVLADEWLSASSFDSSSSLVSSYWSESQAGKG